MICRHNFCSWWLSCTGLVITAGMDKRVICWDTRIDEVIAHSKDVNADVASISVFGYNLMVAIGASVFGYDLRSLDRPLLYKESLVDAQIRCISSNIYFKGMS